MPIINYDDKVNELKMEDIIYHGPDLSGFDDYLVVDWVLIHGCNYKCSYCFGQSELSKKDFTPIDVLKNSVDKIFNLKKQFYVFSLLGGEVTYHPDFLELIEHIYSYKDRKIFVKIASNCSKSIEYFDKLLSYVGNNNFVMNFSVHFEYADIEHIKELIILFNKYKVNICINLMLHPNYIEKIKEYFNELISLKRKYYFDFTLTELREPPTFNVLDSRYDESFFDWVKECRDIIKNVKTESEKFENRKDLRPSSLFTIIKNNEVQNISIGKGISLQNKLKSFKYFYCCVGIKLIHIRADGKYRGAVCTNSPVIGNIYYDKEIDFYKLTNFVKCTQLQCGCGMNDNLSKFRNIDEAKKYVLNYRKKYPELMMEYLLNTIEELKKDINSNNKNKVDDVNKNLTNINNRVNDVNKNLTNINNRVNDVNKNLTNVNNKVNSIDNKFNNKINRLIDTLAWWIPFKKKRDEFRNKFK